MKTSEPHASEWISKAIGEVDVERFRESRTKGVFPKGRESEQRDITREPLVMASEIAGLDPLHGNLVVQMRFPYMELAERAAKFVERSMQKPTSAAPQTVAVATPKPVVEEPVMQRKSPQPVQQKQEQKVAEQHPYFE